MLFGYETEGKELVDTRVCILTGKPIEAGDAMFTVPGTKYFYRVSASALSEHTEEKRAAILAQVPQEEKPAKKSKGSE